MSRIRLGQPEKLSSSHLPARCQPYPDLRRLSQPYGRGLVRRWLSKQPGRIQNHLQLIVQSACFTGKTEPRHAALAFQPPSKPCRPRIVKSAYGQRSQNGDRLAIFSSHCPRQVAFDLTLTGRGSLIVELFAFGQSQFNFGLTFFKV